MNQKKYEKYKNSEIDWIGEIPQHWEMRKAKYIFKEIIDKNHPNDELLSVMKGKGLIPRKDVESGVVMAFKDLQNFKLVKSNQFVIHLRSFQSGFEMSKIRGIVSPAYSVFESITDENDPNFYKYLFYCGTFINYLSSLVLSMRDGKPISFGEFGDMLLYIPPKDEQQVISSFLDEKLSDIDNIIGSKQNQIEILQSYRRSIITEIVTHGLNLAVEMKDSFVDWIGEIPSHWKIKKIKHFSKHIGSGKTPKGGSEVYTDEGILFLRSQNIHNDALKLNDVVYITKEIDKEMSNSRVKYNDILLNITGASIGRASIYKLDTPANVNQHVCIIRLGESGIFPEYLHFVITSNYVQSQIMFSQNGISREGLNFSQIANIVFAIPPSIEEQKEICSVISRKTKNVSALISNIQEQIVILEKYRQSLIYEAVTGKIDVRNFAKSELEVKI